MKVIFDSSFLMAVADNPTSWREDIGQFLGKYDPVILDCAKAELESLSERRGRRGKLATVALEMADEFSVVTTAGGRVDDETVSAALVTGACVATVDAELAVTLRALKVAVVGLRRGRVNVSR